MTDFIIKETFETPTIEFYASMGYLLIKGKSISNNPVEFFDPLVDFLDEYKKDNLNPIKVDFKLEYFNTSSSKCILNILRKLKDLTSVKNELTINWFYDEDDEEILEVGEDFSAIVDYSFHFKSIPLPN